jgi:hypothetical protein
MKKEDLFSMLEKAFQSIKTRSYFLLFSWD